ncbi:hypothetical protein JCM5296_000913 [Sporobolomyces johnsonii]
MTPPIPVSAPRKRPSKSCVACRTAKTSCRGLDEAYLHQLDSADFTPDNYPGGAPRCDRCQRIGVECTFAPSRRKGRPRRLATQRPSLLTSPTTPPPGQLATSSSFSPSRQGSSHDLSPLFSDPAAPILYFPLPPPLPCPSLPIQPLNQLAARYLAEIYPWAPILPSDPLQLELYLLAANPVLPASIACLLDPSLPTPPFDPVGDVSLATLQAGAVLALHFYGTTSRPRARDVLRWTCEKLQEKGWAGEGTAQTGGAAEDDEAFVQLVCAGFTSIVHPHADVSGKTAQIGSSHAVLLHSLALLYDATDYARLRDSDCTKQADETAALVHRAEHLYAVAASFLHHSFAPHSSDPCQSDSFTSATLAAACESALLAASIAPASIVLLLSSTSSFSSWIAPALHCSLDTTSKPSGPARLGARRAASQILAAVRASISSEGPGATRTHGPLYGCSLLVAAWGLLLGAELALCGAQEDGAGAVHAVALEGDLDLCEAVLRQQARRWSCAESLATEVGLLRRTAEIDRVREV